MVKRKHEDSELVYGQFFIEWLNDKYGFDYSAEPNKEESSSSDVFGKSTTGDILSIQVVTSDGETKRLARINTTKIANGDDIECIEVTGAKWLGKALTDKINKHYDNAKDLIILIEGYSATPNPEEIEKCIMPTTIPFRGVYFVSLPKISSTRENFETNGYVVAIKSAF